MTTLNATETTTTVRGNSVYSGNSVYTQKLNARRAEVRAEMDRLTFGVELETEGTRSQVAQAIALGLTEAGIQATVSSDGGYYDKWVVTLADGRKWTCMRDGSLPNGGCEVVSPICHLTDMPMVQEVARLTRKAGATVSSNCGMHVHVGNIQDPKQVSRLAQKVAFHEETMFQAFAVAPYRQGTFTKPASKDFIKALVLLGSKVTMSSLCNAWYQHNGGSEGRSAILNLDSASEHYNHYHTSRYHGLNLHSFFARGTIEFRYFEGTLHAGVIRSFITFCVGMVANAKTKASNGRTSPNATQKALMSKLVANLGLSDKTVLEHLLKNFPRTNNVSTNNVAPIRRIA